ncbi:DUF6597 domain-containing transcriptional factor [Bacteroidota bacterium]
MRFEYFQPSGVLSNYIKQYWIIETDNSDGEIVERVIPNGTIDVMFHYKNELFVKRGDGNEYNQPKSFISGVNNSYADVYSRGEIGMICVEFHPFAASCFFRQPLKEIENSILNLEFIYKQEIRDIEEQLIELDTSKKRIDLIEKFLLLHLQIRRKYDLDIIKIAVNSIKHKQGNISTKELSKALYTTPKTLERKFATLLGKTPKQYSKIVRFQQVINSFNSNNSSSFTDLAYLNGYHDQAHFIKEFKSFSGYTPKEFFKIFHPTQEYLQ